MKMSKIYTGKFGDELEAINIDVSENETSLTLRFKNEKFLNFCYLKLREKEIQVKRYRTKSETDFKVYQLTISHLTKRPQTEFNSPLSYNIGESVLIQTFNQSTLIEKVIIFSS